MRKLHPLTELLALAAVIAVGHPDRVFGQALNFTPPNPVSISIAGPGQTASTAVTVSAPPFSTQISSIVVDGVATSGGNWLCATASGVSLSIGIGVGCSTTTNQLIAGQTYNGQVTLHGDTGASGTLSIILSVGTSSGGTAGLVATPNPLNITSTGITSQTVNITFNGAATTITQVTTSGQSWLATSFAFGSVTVTVNPSGLSGTNSATVFVTTTAGSLSFPVNFTVGSGSAFGFATSPSPVSFNVVAGSGQQSQTVNLTFNGSTVSVNSFSSSTNSGQGWLQVSNTSITGSLLVTVTPQFFTGTSDTGTVSVNTSAGFFSFQVFLTVGSGSSLGLTVSPNPLSLSVPFGSGSSSQNVSVLYNGSPVAITSVSATTGTGQAWLVPSNPFITGSVTVGINPSILATGNYTGTVSIGTQFGQINLPVNLAVGTGSSSGLVANPATVTFNVPLVGAGAVPPNQTVNITFNGAATQVQSVTSTAVGQTWLILSPSASSVGVSVNGASLTQGTYSATVTVNTISGTVNFQVTVNVATGGASGFVVTPNPVVLNAAVGGAITSQAVTVTFSGSAASISSVSASTSAGQNWLQATATSGVPGGVTVTANPAGLAAGTYSGTVTANTTTGVTTFQVTFTVGGGGSGLVVSPNSLSFSAAVGGSAPAQTATVTANGVAATITSVSATTTTGQNWVQANSSGGGVVTVNVTPSILVAGTYTGTVSVNTTSGTTSFQVTLTVGSGGVNPSGLVANPSPVTFNVAAAGQNPTQNVTVTLNAAPQTVTSFTFAPVPILGPNFLNLGINADGSVTLTVNNVVTTPGVYQGTLTLYTSTGNVAVPVTLNFGTGGGGQTGLAANPNPVNFNVQVGGSTTAQNVTITLNGAPVAITAVNSSVTWLVPSFTSGVAGNVSVGVNAAGLGAGTYTGTVTVTTTSGPVTFQANLVVGGGPPPSSPTILVTPASLPPINFQIGGTAPQPQNLNVSLQGGGAAIFTATATTATGGQWISVSPATGNTPNVVTVTINPAGLAAGTYQGSVSIAIALATNSPVTVPITLIVAPAAVIKPDVVAIQNAASALPTSISPGLNILIFGSNMGPGTLTLLQVGANGTLATTVAGTQVTFDGTAAPIIFTSSNLVSVMVPYEIANKVSTSMVVTFNGVASSPVNLRVVNTAPGIYTLNQSGAGQGAILNQNGTVNSTANPEVEGNIIQIFATGEGVTTPAGVTGAITPNRLPLPRPSAAVTVTIGGKVVPDADVTFVGEAPGLLAGVIQVNARIPAGVGSGAVSVEINIGGVPSQRNVTVSIR